MRSKPPILITGVPPPGNSPRILNIDGSLSIGLMNRIEWLGKAGHEAEICFRRTQPSCVTLTYSGVSRLSRLTGNTSKEMVEEGFARFAERYLDHFGVSRQREFAGP